MVVFMTEHFAFEMPVSLPKNIIVTNHPFRQGKQRKYGKVTCKWTDNLSEGPLRRTSSRFMLLAMIDSGIIFCLGIMFRMLCLLFSRFRLESYADG